jgi:L-seryl-tRNA(Ser) seleniumtransferase
VEDLVDSKQELMRMIPSVERVLEHPDLGGIDKDVPRWVVKEAARSVLAKLREAIAAGTVVAEEPLDEIVARVRAEAHTRSKRGIRRVINATGIIIHTNLGRSLLSQQAVEAAREVAGSYSALEFDLGLGKRTSRTKHVEVLLRRIIDCEAAFVVNNNAAAVMIVLNTLSEGYETIVSRGELIEIGGSFRLPEVMDKSGAKMVEVGTTNRTRLEDYLDAITGSTRVILKVHQSNFEMTGFVESVSAKDLAELAHTRGLVIVEDLGSGALVDLGTLGVEREPMPQESLRNGVDVVTFSGDKLLCGPQAGVVVGKQDLLDRIRSNPLARALRVGKMTLAALEVTLRQYLEDELIHETLPTLKMISHSPGDLAGRASSVSKALSQGLAGIATVAVTEGFSQIGGGSLPGSSLKGPVIAISSDRFSADAMVSILRRCDTPIVARISEDRVMIDLRTVQPSEDEILIEQVLAAFAGGGNQ